MEMHAAAHQMASSITNAASKYIGACFDYIHSGYIFHASLGKVLNDLSAKHDALDLQVNGLITDENDFELRTLSQAALASVHTAENGMPYDAYVRMLTASRLSTTKLDELWQKFQDSATQKSDAFNHRDFKFLVWYYSDRKL